MPSTPRRLPSGSWNCYAYLGKDAEGKRIQRSVTRPTKAEARAAAVELEQSAPAAIAASPLTLGEAMTRFIDSRVNVLSKSTVVGYRRIQKNYLHRLQRERLESITQDMIQTEINACAETLSPKTVSNIHGFLSAVFAAYRPDMHLKTRLPQKIKQEIIIPELSTIQAVEAYAREHHDFDLLLSVMLASQLGLRRSEICALMHDDISPAGDVTVSKALVIDEQKEWVLKPPKSRAGFRTLPLTGPIKALLEDPAAPKSGKLVQSNPNVIGKRFRNALAALKLPPCRFHDLRHYNASVMIALNVPFMYIARRMGHENDEMVRRVYGHIMEQKQEDINAMMNQFFK